MEGDRHGVSLQGREDAAYIVLGKWMRDVGCVQHHCPPGDAVIEGAGETVGGRVGGVGGVARRNLPKGDEEHEAAFIVVSSCYSAFLFVHCIVMIEYYIDTKRSKFCLFFSKNSKICPLLLNFANENIGIFTNNNEC